MEIHGAWKGKNLDHFVFWRSLKLICFLLTAWWPTGCIPGLQKVRQKWVRIALYAYKGLIQYFMKYILVKFLHGKGLGGIWSFLFFTLLQRWHTLMYTHISWCHWPCLLVFPLRLNLQIECKRVTSLNPLSVEWAFELTRANMQTL